MEEMMRFYQMADGPSFPTQTTLILNTTSPLIKKLEAEAESDPQKAKDSASYLYRIALLSQKKFSPEEMQSFMKDSFDLLLKL